MNFRLSRSSRTMPLHRKRPLSPSSKGSPCEQVSLLRKGSPFAALLREDDASYSMISRQTGMSHKRVAKEFGRVASQSTPYGPIWKSFDIATDEGPVKIEYACPFAFLHHACATTPLYDLICSALGSSLQGRIVIYWDETKPGNVLRPDVARSMTVIFWGSPISLTGGDARQLFGLYSHMCPRRSCRK